MRTIKSISIIAVLAIAGLSSCSKDSATDPLVVDNSLTQPTPTALVGTTALADTKVAATALPQIILDYMTANYPNATITKSEIEDNGNYEVKLNNGTELIFGADGAFLGIDNDTDEDFDDAVVDLATLPQSITDYIAANHSGLTIAHAEMENNGHYEVELSDGTELVFDGKGVFLGIGVDNDDHNGSDDDQITLPQGVIDYVAANYPKTTISASEVEDNGNYEVELNNGTELVFEANGNFLRMDSDDDGHNGSDNDQVTLPKAVKDYVAANYPNATISESEMEDNGNYEVELNNGTKLIFDANGNFLRTDNDSEDQNGNELEDGTVIDAATLPQLVKDYLSTTYPDATIVEASTMADGGFEIELSTKIEVIFDANGSFVKTEDGSTEHGD